MKYYGCLLFFSIIQYCCLAQQTSTQHPYARSKEIIRDYNKVVTPNGIQESYAMTIGGVKQWIYVRGQDRANPIILFVHGGPASPLSPVMWLYQKSLEEYFTVINYDQRASGKTYVSNDTTQLGNTIYIDTYVDDAITLADSLCKKYNKQKLILIGHSWGTIVSMKAVMKRPDLFYAYVGIGQVINTRDNEELSFQFAVEQATRLKNETALKELKSIAPYPGNQPITRERIIIARKWPQYYGGLSAYRVNSQYFFDAPNLSPEYTPEDVAGIDQGSAFTLGRILPEFLAVDFKSVKTFPIPVFMFMGRHDYTTPSVPTQAWIDAVKAPQKQGIWFENSAHLIPMEEPGKMLLSLVMLVRPLAIEKGIPKTRK